MSKRAFVDNEYVSYPYVLRNGVSSVSTTMQNSTAQANCDTQVTDSDTSNYQDLFFIYATNGFTKGRIIKKKKK